MTQITLNNNTYSDNDAPANSADRYLGGQGNRLWFFPMMSDFVVVAGQAQAWSAQAQAAAGAGGGTIFPVVSVADAGKTLLVNAAGNAYVAANTQGFKNFLLNGDFEVWQRGTTFASLTVSTALYTADAWMAFRLGLVAGLTLTRQVYTGYKSARLQRTAGNTLVDQIRLTQSLESIDVEMLRGKTVTVQFKALAGANFSAASGVMFMQFLTGTGTDGNIYTGFTSSAVALTRAATLTTSNQTFTVTGVIPSTATQAGILFYYTPVGTAGAADFFEVSDVQVEVSPVATEMQRLPYTLALWLCQRRFNIVRGVMGVAAGFAAFFTNTMRATPTLSGLTIASGTGGTIASNGATMVYQTAAHSAVSTYTINASADL